MITIQQAAKAARDFAKELYAGEELRDLRIEAIESSEDDKKWLVTLGWVEPAVQEIGGFTRMGSSASIEAIPRVYKIFLVNSESGVVESIRMLGR